MCPAVAGQHIRLQQGGVRTHAERIHAARLGGRARDPAARDCGAAGGAECGRHHLLVLGRARAAQQ